VRNKLSCALKFGSIIGGAIKIHIGKATHRSEPGLLLKPNCKPNVSYTSPRPLFALVWPQASNRIYHSFDVLTLFDLCRGHFGNDACDRSGGIIL
jgi:hypothetical protein